MPRTLTITRMGTPDILKALNERRMEVVRDAYERGMNLSVYMEHMNPTDPADLERPGALDAFGRCLREAGILTRSVPAAGFWADKWEDAFDKTPEARILGLEWVARQCRRVANPGHDVSTRSVFGSDLVGLPSALREYFDAAAIRSQQLTPPIPLSQMVAITTPITGDAYRAVYLTDTDNPNKRWVRVGEGAEIPRIMLKTSERDVRLYKFGRALEQSYEFIRRQRLDRMALLIAMMATQAETDKVAIALDAIINGDGNSGTSATTYNLTTLDSGTTANNLTLKAWLRFKLKFAPPYSLTSMLGQEDSVLSALLLNTGSPNLLVAMVDNALGIGQFVPMNNQLSGSVLTGWTPDAPAGKLVGWDRRVALERVVEIGSNIVEMEKFVMRQTQAIVMTETEGYAIIDPRATKILNLAA